jgi:crotonobetainyl-CoA:carnitine CoA-transferase CaiB-like acyl-CoA transferase
VTVLRSGYRLSDGDPGPEQPPPELGQDTDTLLAELGYADEERARMRQEGAI